MTYACTYASTGQVIAVPSHCPALYVTLVKRPEVASDKETLQLYFLGPPTILMC